MGGKGKNQTASQCNFIDEGSIFRFLACFVIWRHRDGKNTAQILLRKQELKAHRKARRILFGCSKLACLTQVTYLTFAVSSLSWLQ